MLGNSLGDMVKVWEAMNSNLKIQIGNIRASFQKSFYEVEHAHISPFYDNLRGSVSRAALRRIAEELSRLDYVLNSRETCGCTMRTSYGLPCACEMGRSIVVGIPLQIESVHLHWRILSMEGFSKCSYILHWPCQRESLYSGNYLFNFLFNYLF